MIFKLLNYTTIVLLILFITKVLCECTIEYPVSPSTQPRFDKILGSRKVNIPNNNDYKIMQSNEEIVAYCDIKFEEPEIYQNLNKLKIKCHNRGIIINENYYSSSVHLECSPLKWNLYELSKPMFWCPSDMASYILARQNDISHLNYVILSGICYDTDNMSLRSVFYTISPKHLSPWPLQSTSFPINYPPLIEIKYLKETFGSKNITADTYDNQQFQDWIKFANYQFNSTIQNPILFNEIYSEFGSLLDFAWWPNLRLGNWKIYEEALARQIEYKNTSYAILSGISDVVMAPIKTNCQTNFTMTDLIDTKNNKIPLYIWNYVKPKLPYNNSDEVVVIGFNSPFYEFYDEKDVVFCQDICSEIDWLKNVHSTFRYSAMGIMFCCSVQEVKTSKRLSGFPENIDETTIETTTKQPKIIPTQRFYTL